MYKLPPLHVVPCMNAEKDVTPDFIKELEAHGILYEGAIHKTISPFQIAVALSTIQAWKFFLEKTQAEWTFIFEDDARVVNCPEGTDLTVFHNIPEDAQMISLGRGTDELFSHPHNKALPTWGGGLAHAFLLSRQGAHKLLKHVYPIFRVLDMYIHSNSVFFGMAGYGYCFNDLVDDEKPFWEQSGRTWPPDKQRAIHLYRLHTRLFEQTSNPTPSLAAPGASLEERMHMIRNKKGGYAIPPLNM